MFKIFLWLVIKICFNIKNVEISFSLYIYFQKPKYQHTRGATPRHFQFDPSGEWLVVANQDSNHIGIFHFSSSTGGLEYTGNEYYVPSPNFVCCVEPHIEQFDSSHDNYVKDSRMLAKLFYENM